MLTTWHNLRQQNEKPPGNPNQCLADFVAPKDSGVPDYFGAFAVTAGIGIDAKVKEFEAKNDDYSAIMVKALADRLAEAFAEHLHHRVRTEFWVMPRKRNLQRRALARSTPGSPPRGYPASPTTREGRSLHLLDAGRNAEMILTDSSRCCRRLP